MSETLTPASIRLPEAEAELALAEANAVLAAASAEGYRAELAALVEAIESRLLDHDEAASLEPIVELALQTGRIRALYGPPGEQAALRLYRRLPRGRALQESAREVSQALSSLHGRLEGASDLRARPGRLHALARDRRGQALDPPRPPGRQGHVGRGLSDAGLRILHGVPRPDRPPGARRRRRHGGAREGRRASSRRGAAVTVVAPQITPELAGLDVDPRPPRLPDRGSRRRLPRRRRDEHDVRQPPGLPRRRGPLASSATSSTCRSSAPSSCPPFTATSRSRSPSRPAAPRPRSRSTSATGSPRSSRPEHAELADRLRTLRPWAKSHFATYDERKAYFAGLVAQELG